MTVRSGPNRRPPLEIHLSVLYRAWVSEARTRMLHCSSILHRMQAGVCHNFLVEALLLVSEVAGVFAVPQHAPRASASLAGE